MKLFSKLDNLQLLILVVFVPLLNHCVEIVHVLLTILKLSTNKELLNALDFYFLFFDANLFLHGIGLDRSGYTRFRLKFSVSFSRTFRYDLLNSSHFFKAIFSLLLTGVTRLLTSTQCSLLKIFFS